MPDESTLSITTLGRACQFLDRWTPPKRQLWFILNTSAPVNTLVFFGPRAAAVYHTPSGWANMLTRFGTL